MIYVAIASMLRGGYKRAEYLSNADEEQAYASAQRPAPGYLAALRERDRPLSPFEYEREETNRDDYACLGKRLREL